MSEQHTVNYLGWLEEQSYGTDPNPNSNTHYVLGKNVTGNLPNPKQEFTVNHNESYAPKEIVTTKHLLETSPLTYEPVNALAWKYMFAGIDGTGITDDGGANLTDGIRTVDPTALVPLAQRASWAFRSDEGNSQQNLRDHYLGNRMLSLVASYNFIGGSAQRLIEVMNYIGQKRATPATDVSNPPIYPQSTKESYKKDTNTVLTWNGQDLIPAMANISTTIQNEPQAHPVDAQKFVEQETTGNQTYAATLNIRRADGNSADLWTDFRSQMDNDDSYNTLIWNIFNTTTQYRAHTFTGCRITEVRRNIVQQAGVAIPTYEIGLVPLAMVPTFKDGLNKTTFYNL